MSQIRYSITAKCYDKRGRMISEGQNSYTKTHPLMLTLAKDVGLDEKIYLHAEVQALLRAGERKVHTMKIMRQTKDGVLANAKPCPICAKALKLFGAQFVQYSIVGSLVRQSVETL